MLIGYARVSTLDQSADLQNDALKAAGCKQIYTETASGARTDRPVLQEVMRYLRNGEDLLVVWELDRLARSMVQLTDTINILRDRQIELRSLTENIDTSSSGGRLFFHIFGSIAEFERELIRERTFAGLEPRVKRAG